MAAVLVEITDCVLADFSAAYGIGRLSQPIRGVRGYVPEFTPGGQDYGVFQVYVSSDKEEGRRVSRNSVEYDYAVEVGVCCRLPNSDNATVDPAMQLIQEMADYFFDYGLSNEKATWMRNEVYFWPDRGQIKFDGAFFALWQMTFEGTRSRT